jgi:hypothetical protein
MLIVISRGVVSVTRIDTVVEKSALRKSISRGKMSCFTGLSGWLRNMPYVSR